MFPVKQDSYAGEILPPYADHAKGEKLKITRLSAWNYAVRGAVASAIILGFTVGPSLTRDLPFFRTCHIAPTPKGPIDWQPCGAGFECGRLDVPLDYHNPSAGNASLAVGRYLATSKTRKSSLFLNPGGPGGSGMSFLYRAGPQLSEVLNGEYDIVSWDPRGINGTTPRVECFPDRLSQDVFNLEHGAGLESHNFSNPAELELIRAQLRITFAEDQLLAGLCEERMGDDLKHMGTATVVRDLENLATVIEGKDSPINFWGFSYGTAVGSYFVNMFPDRVGRVIIDGNVDPTYWADMPEYQWAKYDFEDTERAYYKFLSSCVEAGPTRCALSSNSTSTGELDKAIRALIDLLYLTPLPVPHADRPGLLRSSTVRDTIFGHMYRPREWPLLAKKLAAALAGDGALLLNDAQPTLNASDTRPQGTNQAIWAVTCPDGPHLSPRLEKEGPEGIIDALIDSAVGTYEETTTLFAGLSLSSMCFQWKTREVERFSGPFNSSLANPILIIGNTADPITPLVNAKTVNSLLPDSRLVIQDGPGHCSLAQVSLCTARIVREYFLSGTLPPNGKICATTEILFPEEKGKGPSFVDGVATWGAEIMQQMSAEDLSLLESLKAFGEAAQEEVRSFKRPRRA